MYRIIHYRDLLTDLTLRQVKIHYRRSVLGILWSLLNPLLTLVVFSFVFQQVVPLNIKHYSAYVFCGLLAWNWFSSSVNMAAYTITFNRELVRRPEFNTEILVVVNVASNMINYLLALPILLGLLLVDGLYPGWNYFLLPLILLIQFMFTLGLSLIISALNVFYRDIGHLISAVIVIWFYVTPVFYLVGATKRGYEWVFNINPMALILDMYRNIFINAEMPDAMIIGIVSVVSIVMLLIGYLVFSRLKHNFVDEL
jgi:ABC-type polysaccharide/polyol phosphate export permease